MAFNSRSVDLNLHPASARESDAAFYDATIDVTWRLALCLHDGDRTRAASAVVAAYRTTSRTGVRDRTALLARLVDQARTARTAPPTVPDGLAPVVPLPRHPQAPAPA